METISEEELSNAVRLMLLIEDIREFMSGWWDCDMDEDTEFTRHLGWTKKDKQAYAYRLLNQGLETPHSAHTLFYGVSTIGHLLNTIGGMEKNAKLFGFIVGRSVRKTKEVA